MNSKRWAVLLGATLAITGSAVSRSAKACGGFFCSQAQPVNQAAERIVFAHNGDGTVTAVIEIQYQGPSESFSWLLPISTVPMGDQIAVASKVSFDRLQSATNPQYSLITTIEGECDPEPPTVAVDGSPSSGGSTSAGNPGSGVMVEASGVVGRFEWTVISLDDTLSDPAAAAVTWLGDNGYDVPAGAEGLLGPYLEDGLFLLALRLQKGADTGSIRPIALSYAADQPMIPIKLTAVAANADMGVMTWVLGEAQAVPMNYYALELNEARINWFNASPTYNSVVIAAADEAGGQGFVTEYAQNTSQLAEIIWSASDEASWDAFVASANVPGQTLVQNALFSYSGWDGFWDVFRDQVTLPAGLTVEQVQACPFCRYPPLATVPADFIAALESEVIEPARLLQDLFDAHDVVTRMYTTMSAEEMTADPFFSFNPDLEPVSNIHQAERIIECAPGYFQFNAPWRIELPQGGVVRGGPNEFGIWPASFDELPANRRIMRQGETGLGQVLEDNSESIDEAIQAYSETVPTPEPHGTAGSSSTPSGGSAGTTGADPTPDDSMLPSGGVTPGGGAGCGCVVAGNRKPLELAWALLGLLALGARRRRSG